jgi:hypothetical protein
MAIKVHMIKKLMILTYITFLILCSCNEKQSNLEFEKSVVKEIFPALLDSVHHDRRLNPLPPPSPPPPKLDGTANDSALYEWDEEKMIAEFEKRKSEIKKDTTKLVVALVDSTYLIETSAKIAFIDFYHEFDLQLDTVHKQRYKINISDLEYNEKFKIEYRSKFPSGSKVWDVKYDFYLSGITWMSKICFDKTKRFGVLESGFGCGKLCGFGGIVMIKKVKGKWIIDEIIVHTVS